MKNLLFLSIVLFLVAGCSISTAPAPSSSPYEFLESDPKVYFEGGTTRVVIQHFFEDSLIGESIMGFPTKRWKSDSIRLEDFDLLREVIVIFGADEVMDKYAQWEKEQGLPASVVKEHRKKLKNYLRFAE